MFFVGASPLATELFGFEDRGSKKPLLTGRSMKDFLDILKYRMPGRQYDEFLASQNQARSQWTEIDAADSWRTPTVHIPIVFNRHPRNEHFVGRAYLPIIVSKFDSASWSTLRVLYLDVTSVLQEEKVEEDLVYVCEIDPQSRPLKLPPTPDRLNVFLCHNSQDKSIVETILGRLKKLSPLAVNPWMDKTDIVGGEGWVSKIGKIIRNADVAFVFLGKNGIGPTQEREIEILVKSSTDPNRKKLVILPVLLDAITEIASGYARLLGAWFLPSSMHPWRSLTRTIT